MSTKTPTLTIHLGPKPQQWDVEQQNAAHLQRVAMFGAQGDATTTHDEFFVYEPSPAPQLQPLRRFDPCFDGYEMQYTKDGEFVRFADVEDALNAAKASDLAADEANARSEALNAHLRQVIEIARCWMPGYATQADRAILDGAAAALRP